MGSNMRFGFVLVAACAIVYALTWRHETANTGWLMAAIVLLLITLAMPRTLQPLKNLWLKVGGLLHVVVSPVLLGLFYFGGVVPIGLAMQALGKDPLRLKRHDKSYWIERRPPGPDPRTMKEVF